MKTSTLKNLFGASLMVMAGLSASYAQSNAINAPNQPTGGTAEEASYEISLADNVTKSGSGRQPFSIECSSSSVVITEAGLNSQGALRYNITIPQGTPLGVSVSLVMNGIPFWHVTVADILGQNNSDPDVAMRPLGIDNSESENNGDDDGSTAIILPPVVNTGSNTASSIGSKASKIDLYPNPATDQISIVTEGEVLWGVCEIIDITGKKILEIPTGVSVPANGIDRHTIMVSQLKPGTYLVRFRTNKDVYTKRFQVAR